MMRGQTLERGRTIRGFPAFFGIGSLRKFALFGFAHAVRVGAAAGSHRWHQQFHSWC